MPFAPARLYSDIAQSGPPLFYPDPPVPVTFNFDQNLPDEATFPLDEIVALHNEVAKRDRGRALEYISLGYDDDKDTILYLSTYIELVLGNTELREEIAKWLMRRQGAKGLVPDGIILSSGSVGAIGLGINAFVDEGDAVFVENNTFPYALRYFQMRKASIHPVTLDENGMDTDALERAIVAAETAGERPKMIYIIANFQMPTGVCTSLERRRRILELAEEHDMVVLDDNVYGDLRYSGEDIPSLLSLDTAGRVLQAHSFSKVVMPGMRLGWMAGQPEMIAPLAAVRQDLGMSQWTSRAMALYVQRGRLDEHIEAVKPIYRRKRDLAAEGLREHCSPYVTFTPPDGGYFMWIELADGVDWEKARVYAVENGVAFRPGERFVGPDMKEIGKKYFRLAFSHVKEEELKRGLAALGEAIHKAAR
jgi:2-aminoadipate transaminase